MTAADHARNNAISLEAKKDALSQRQSGDWKVSFTVQGIDMDTRLTQAPMGTRYAVVLVEIGDDELPVVGAVAPTAGRSMAMGKRAEQGNQGGRHALAPDDSHDHRENAAGDDPTPRRPAREKMDWRDMQPAAQAALRCDQPAFRTFLMEEHSFRPRDPNSSDETAEFLRNFFNVKSRSELGTDPRRRVLWKQMDDQFQAWKALEHA
jgi:hypothetical protein